MNSRIRSFDKQTMLQFTSLGVWCVLIIFLLTIKPCSGIKSIISNPVYRTRSSNKVDALYENEWREIPKRSVSVFGAVRNNTLSGQDKLRTPVMNTILSPTGFQFVGRDDGSSLYSALENKVSSQRQEQPQSQPISKRITEEESEKFTGNLDDSDSSHFKNNPSVNEQLSREQYPIWNLRAKNGLYRGRQAVLTSAAEPPPPPARTPSLLTPYATGVPHANRRNLFYPKYTTGLNTPVQQDTRWRRTSLFSLPSSNMLRYNGLPMEYPLNLRIRGTQPQSRFIFRQLPRIPVARQYVQSNQLQPEVSRKLQPYGQVVTPQNNTINPRSLSNINRHDGIRRLFG
uniref:Uncharacterized protein n=1 Tax=Trichobilharzia regenti TaxID=157069 RepID=A0AA85JJT6_TRIRE|nr:unnamed protein product [Trichobilharzia regenti]